jgi:hypothetical protein
MVIDFFFNIIRLQRFLDVFRYIIGRPAKFGEAFAQGFGKVWQLLGTHDEQCDNCYYDELRQTDAEHDFNLLFAKSP